MATPANAAIAVDGHKQSQFHLVAVISSGLVLKKLCKQTTWAADLGRTEIFFELEQNYFSILNSNSNKNLELFELERRTRTPLENQFKKYSRTILFQVLKPNKKMA